MNSTTFFLGLASSAGLIIAIGAQNAFVLRQGLRREHVATVVLVCALTDMALISLGVLGIGTISRTWPWAVPLLTLGGVAFLAVYGLQAARRAWKPAGGGLEASGGAPLTRGAVALQAAAFSWLNPHAWLDTTVLLGSLAQAQPAGEQSTFALGAMTASALWFTLLAWAAGRLSPLFRQPRAWRVLDAGIALMMMTLAGTLTLHAVRS